MAFTKLTIQKTGPDTRSGTTDTSETDIWAIFRALRDSRSVFGLRPGHVQTLQAMLSFLRPGHGHTVFASNHEICRRIGGIDERTLRRHIDRFCELGFMSRHDSPNRKRYRVKASDGTCISYGLSLAPLMARAKELLDAAQELENNRRDRLFLRKQILSRLATIEDNGLATEFCSEVRKMLRRQLSVAEYRALLDKLTAICATASTAVDIPITSKMPASDGQNVRHQSKSEKKQKDLESADSDNTPAPQKLISICSEARAFAATPLKGWRDIIRHATMLAPMMGIPSSTFETAKRTVGPERASTVIFILLQIGKRVRNFSAYFCSVTIGRRKDDFKPSRILQRLDAEKAAYV